MSYGLNVFSSSGELLCSDAWSSFHFLGRASLMSSASRGATNSQRWQIGGYAGFPPVAFLRTNGSTYAAVDAVKDMGGGVWDIWVMGTASEVLCFSTLPNVAPTETFGLQVRNAAGQVTFDTTRKPLNVRWLTTFGPGYLASDISGMAIGVPGLSQPAFFLPTGGVRRTYTWGNNSDSYNESVIVGRISGGTMNFSNPSIFNQTFPHAFEPEPPAPDFMEDAWAPTMLALIEGAHY